jgi:hypothetical protein
MYRKEISSNYKEKNKERKRYKRKKSKPRGANNGRFIYV